MRARLPFLRLALLAGLALPPAALAADPLNMPPSAGDPVNGAPAQPKSAAAEAAAARDSVVTPGSIAAEARREIADSYQESRENLDAGVRGQRPPTRATAQTPSQAAAQRTAEDAGAFEGLNARERAEAQQAIDRMSTFGQGDCEEIDYGSQKAKVRKGLTQGQQYGLQNEAAMRATGQAELIALADKLQKQREAYGNTDERVEEVGGGCQEDAKPQRTAKAPKPPAPRAPRGSRGPKAPQPAAAAPASAPVQGPTAAERAAQLRREISDRRRDLDQMLRARDSYPEGSHDYRVADRDAQAAWSNINALEYQLEAVSPGESGVFRDGAPQNRPFREPASGDIKDRFARGLRGDEDQRVPPSGPPPRQAAVDDRDSPEARELRNTISEERRRLDQAMRLLDDAAEMRRRAVESGETPPDTTARDRDLGQEIDRLQTEINALESRLSRTSQAAADEISNRDARNSGPMQPGPDNLQDRMIPPKEPKP